MKRLFGVILLSSLLVLSLAACSHTHNFDERQTTVEASCEEPGLKIQECRCGDQKHSQIPPLGHQYEIGEEVEPSCQVEGSITYVCVRCKHSYTEPTELRKYTATELNDMYLESVGELVVYDKQNKQISLGSCFVYTKDGMLVTNYHVIEGGYSAEITIGHRTYRVSSVVDYDKKLDLAILKIPATNLQPVKICRLEHKTGETVYALGNSQGLTSTFSKGMITYSDRESEGVHYVQHDAAISSGNSGGPLINEYGEVIGINTWTLKDSQNLNFAIRIGQIGKLELGWARPMREFYEKELNAFQKLATHLEENGTYRPEYGTYMLMLDTVNDRDLHYKLWAEYAPDQAVVDFFLSLDSEYNTVLQLDRSCSGSYDWYYFDDDFEMFGIVNAHTWTYETELIYDYTDATYRDTAESIRGIASTSVTLICKCITSSFWKIGVTASDFGFVNF
jgi:hypothetical protein